jgi:hypothetical protein
MHALIGRVKIQDGHEAETLAMISQGGVAMVQAMPGSAGAYWAREQDGPDLVQHSFWLFETEQDARAAEVVFNGLRDMPEAPATLVSAAVCEVVGQA